MGLTGVKPALYMTTKIKRSQCPSDVLLYALYSVEPRDTGVSMFHVRHGTPQRKQDVVEAGAYTVTISQHESTILTLDIPYEYPLARV